MSDAAPEPIRIQYEAGSEHSPGDPYGRSVLVLEPAGNVRLDLRHRGRHRAWTGTVEPATIVRVLEALAPSGFPAVPPHTAPGGSSFRLLVIGDGPERKSATLEHHAAKK